MKRKPCEICEEPAHWRRLRDKQNTIKNICDSCLDIKQKYDVSFIDDYKYIEA